MLDDNNKNENINETNIEGDYSEIDQTRHIAYLRDKRKARKVKVFFERLRILLKIIVVLGLGFLLFKLVKYPVQCLILCKCSVNITVINDIAITGVRLDVRSESRDKNNSHLQN